MILDLVKPFSMMFMMLNLVDVSKTSVIDVDFNLFGFLHLQRCKCLISKSTTNGVLMILEYK